MNEYWGRYNELNPYKHESVKKTNNIKKLQDPNRNQVQYTQLAWGKMYSTEKYTQRGNYSGTWI